MEEKPISCSEGEESEWEEKTYVMDLKKNYQFD